MPQTSAATTNNDKANTVRHTKNVKAKEGAAPPITEQLEAMQKSKFQLDCDDTISLEELRTHLLNTVHELWQK